MQFDAHTETEQDYSLATAQWFPPVRMCWHVLRFLQKRAQWIVPISLSGIVGVCFWSQICHTLGAATCETALKQRIVTL